MPRKSDRNTHESAMESLLPEVSLEDDSEEESAEENDSSTELQKSRSTEEGNFRTTQEQDEESPQAPPKTSDPRGSEEAAVTSSPASAQSNAVDHYLEVLPSERPSLKQKLGPYVSQEVDEALEEVYLLLRRELGGKASKSLIVEAALRYALNDYLQRGEDSEVAKWLKAVLEE